MPAIRRHPLLVTLVVAGMLALVAGQLLGQNLELKGKGKLSALIRQSGTIPANSVVQLDADALTDSKLVPLKMTLVITDLIITNGTASEASFFVSQTVVDPAALTHSISVPAGTTFAHNFGTGLALPAGAQANIFATGQPLGFTVLGYLRKG